MAGISTLGQYLDQISRLKTQQSDMGSLAFQINSGKKTNKLSGLGNDILKTTRARVSVNELTVYVDNITNADRRLKLMQTSISEMKKQAENISNSLTVSLQQGDYPDLEIIKKLAANIYDFVVDAMNSKDADKFLFGGANTSQQPITDSGLFASSLGEFVPDSADLTNPPLVASGLIGQWGDGTITTEQFIAAYNATNDTVLGFSNALTTDTAGKNFVRVNDGTEYDYTTLANKTSMRDIIVTLGVIKQMPPVEYAPGALNDPTATTIAGDTPPFPPAEKQEAFYAVLNDLAVTLNKAIDDLDQELFNLSQVQAQISIIKISHTEQIKTYKDIIGDVEEADITEASVKIKALETQIQASFSITALLSQLTLANFLR